MLVILIHTLVTALLFGSLQQVRQRICDIYTQAEMGLVKYSILHMIFAVSISNFANTLEEVMIGYCSHPFPNDRKLDIYLCVAVLKLNVVIKYNVVLWGTHEMFHLPWQ